MPDVLHLSIVVGPLVEGLQVLLTDVGPVLLTQRQELVYSNGAVPDNDKNNHHEHH